MKRIRSGPEAVELIERHSSPFHLSRVHRVGSELLDRIRTVLHRHGLGLDEALSPSS